MRLLFFILLLVNAMVFSYVYYREQMENSKPALPALNAERIRLAGTETSLGKGSSVSDPLTCWTWEGFKDEELDAARAALSALNLGDKYKQSTKEEYWLYIPPLKSKQEAAKKLAELKALTIEDGTLLEERGKWRYAISFAAYPNEDAATVRLNQLKEKGVKSAKLLKREVSGNAFSIQQADVKATAALKQLQIRFTASSLKPLDCQAP